MASLTDLPSAAGHPDELHEDTTGDRAGLFAVPELMERDLDGPTLEILMAALTAADCDQVDGLSE